MPVTSGKKTDIFLSSFLLSFCHRFIVSVKLVCTLFGRAWSIYDKALEVNKNGVSRDSFQASPFWPNFCLFIISFLNVIICTSCDNNLIALQLLHALSYPKMSVSFNYYMYYLICERTDPGLPQEMSVSSNYYMYCRICTYWPRFSAGDVSKFQLLHVLSYLWRHWPRFSAGIVGKFQLLHVLSYLWTY